MKAYVIDSLCLTAKLNWFVYISRREACCFMLNARSMMCSLSGALISVHEVGARKPVSVKIVLGDRCLSRSVLCDHCLCISMLSDHCLSRP